MAGRRALRTVVITDAVGYSARANHDEEGALRELNADFGVMRAAVEAHGGHVVKTTGDGLLITFDIPGQAVDCCLDIQTQFASRGSDSFKHRMGVHLCEVVDDGDDVHGDGVNVAARLETQATPGSIAMSQTVYDIVKSRLTVEPRLVGLRDLKNIPTPVTIYELSPTGTPKRRPAANPTPKRNWGAVAGFTAVVASIGTLAGVIWVRGNQAPEIIVEQFGQRGGKESSAPRTAPGPATTNPTLNQKAPERTLGKPTRSATKSTNPISPPSTVAKLTAPPMFGSSGPLPNTRPTGINASPPAPPPTIADNPFITDPLPPDLETRRAKLVRSYDFDGVLALMNGSDAFKALPYYSVQLRTFQQLSRMRQLVDSTLRDTSQSQPLSVTMPATTGNDPTAVDVWGTIDAGLRVRGPGGVIASYGLATASPQVVRAVAVAALAKGARPGEAKQMLNAFDRVYGALRERKARNKAAMDSTVGDM